MSVAASGIKSSPFGNLPDGTPVTSHTLHNARGAEARILNYGGTVTHLFMPDRSGKFGDVVLGCEDLAGYLKNDAYLGALIGRCGNRIAKGVFSLAGKTYQLAQNNGGNNHHGGVKGFDKVVWDARPGAGESGPALELRYCARDGEEGFPGNLKVMAVYTLTEANALRIDFTATTDQPTLCNLTQHSYFNLAAGDGDILDHTMMIAADRFTPVNPNLIPTGELRPVRGTPFDFTTPRKIGARIQEADGQLKLGRGYDHNYVLAKKAGELALAARVTEETSGRVLEVFTTEAGLQFYTGNFLDGSIIGKGNRVYHYRHGFCLEPQRFPDAPNQPAFPPATLRPGETYRHTISYQFSTQ